LLGIARVKEVLVAAAAEPNALEKRWQLVDDVVTHMFQLVAAEPAATSAEEAKLRGHGAYSRAKC
jgi:hypothetical protein